MTLNELIKKAKTVGDKFNTYDLPLYDEACVEIQDIKFNIEEEDGEYFIQMTIK